MSKKHLKTEQQAIRDALRSNPEGARQLQDMVESGRIASAADMSSDEPVTMLCVRWGTQMVRDCTRGICEKCRHDVALAPSSVAMLAAHKGPVVVTCMECALPELMAAQGK